MAHLHIGDWFSEALHNWQGWLSGGGVGGLLVLLLTAFERLLGWTMPRKWYAIVILAGFFIGANYVAWLSAFQSMKGREVDLHAMEGKFLRAAALLADTQSRLDELETITLPDPPNSLRKKAKKLADDIEEFASVRSARRPVPNYSQNPTPEEKLQQKIFNDYEESTRATCVSRFGPLWREIIQQLGGHGVPVHAQGVDLNWAFREDQDYPQCANSQQTEILRSLAYRIDAKGNLVHF